MNAPQAGIMGAGRGSLGSYAAGYGISILLTVAAFILAASGKLSVGAALGGIFTAAAVQILTHLYFFLHLNGSSAARWNLLALLWTICIMVLFVGGTIWIMWSLSYRHM